jgi:hypothetical protein
MFAFKTASLLLFPGLGLVALAFWLLARRYSTAAFAVGLTGLLALTTASTWITAAGPVTDTKRADELAAENTGLRDRVRGLTDELAEARKRATELEVEVARLAAALQAEQNKRTQAERDAAEAGRRAADETARVAQFEKKAREAEQAKSEAERTVRALEVKVASLEERPADLRPAPPAPKSPDLQSIRKKLTEGHEPFFTAQQEREFISGRKGTWYVIRPLRRGQVWSFEDRQFVLPDPGEIKASLVRFRDDVVVPLSEAGKQWRLYVRGAADARRVAGPVARELTYLPRLPDGTHAPDHRGKRVAVPVQNEALPTLRADWLREIVRPVLGAAGSGEIEILENPPQQGHERIAELVLYVEW